MYKIKLLGTSKDLDDGFYAIMTSGQSSVCLEGETYVVNNITVEKLKQEKIKFKIISEPPLIRKK